MGVYLNSKKPYLMFQEHRLAKYYVDKSKILEELIPVIDGTIPATDDSIPGGKESKYICITRPRRFGKTTAANMISAYFSKGFDSSALFQGLAASSHPWFTNHLNQHNVIRSVRLHGFSK